MIDPPNVAARPRPLLCRMAGVIHEFHQISEEFQAKGNNEGACCMWAAAERLKEECQAFVTEMKGAAR